MSNRRQQTEAETAESQPRKATRRAIEGEVSVRQVASRWDRTNQFLVTAASIGALVASVIIGFSGCVQQNTHMDATVDADRQNSAFGALANVRDFYDSGHRNLAALQQYRKSNGATHQFTANAGQNFDDASRTATSALSVAALKAVGYESNKTLLHLGDVVGRAHAAIAFFYNQVTAPELVGEHRLQDDQAFDQALETATSALTAVSIALENTENTVACEFGYKNGAGAEGFNTCPRSPVPEPTVKLPPGTVPQR